MWYIGVLEKAKEKGVITSFEDNTGRRLSPSASRTAQKDARKPGFLFRSSSASTPKSDSSETNGEGDTNTSRPAKRQRGADGAANQHSQEQLFAGGDDAPASGNDIENSPSHGPSIATDAGFLDLDIGMEMDTMGMGMMSSERQPLSPLSPRSQATASDRSGAQTPPRSLRHIPIFNGDFLAEVIDEVLAAVEDDEGEGDSIKSEPNLSKESAASSFDFASGGNEVVGNSFQRPKLKRTHSDKLVEEVEKRMSNRKMGSYIVCYFDRESLPAETRIEDDPELSIDNKPPQTTLDRRENLIRLCEDRHYQFNTMRHGKFSTMMLLHYWVNKVGLKQVTKQTISQQSSSASPRHMSAEEAMSAQTGSAAVAATGGLAAFDTASNKQQMDKWQQKLKQRHAPKALAPAVASGTIESGGYGGSSAWNPAGAPPPQPVDLHMQPQSQPMLAQQMMVSQQGPPEPLPPAPPAPMSVLPQQPRVFPACTTNDFDRLIVDQLQPALLSRGGTRQLEVVRSFVVHQRQQQIAPHLRVSQLVSKLVKLLGVEVMCQATSQVLGAQVGHIERMVLGSIRDKLTQEQRDRLQEVAHRNGLPLAVHQAGNWIGLPVIGQVLCDVIDYLLTSQR
eukprot:COSAG02_NODE_7946_length_2776_cov_1.643631_2_plen_620_part_00